MNYELLEHENNIRLEKFGPHVLLREWISDFIQNQENLRAKPDSICRDLGHGKYAWEPNLKPWVIDCLGLKVELRLSDSKNIGLFPEQVNNWNWLEKKVKPNQKILNLFAYTGVASLICARAGAHVTHVDSSKSAVKWASDNAKLSGLENKSIRWIADDAIKFLKREVRRNNFYDGIILDPPPFGKASQNKKDNFVFKRDLSELLSLVKKVSGDMPKLFLLNSYALNISPSELKESVAKFFKSENLESGELKLDNQIALSSFVRF